MGEEHARKLWEGNKYYVEYMAEDLPLSEARFLAFRQDELYLLAWPNP